MTRTAPLLLGLLFGVQTALIAQAPRSLDDLVDRRGVYLDAETLEAHTGPVVAMWDAVNVRVRGTLQNGRWDGVLERFYLDGKLEVKETYRNGVLHGPFASYFRTGRPSDRGTYAEGRLQGAYEAFWSRTQGDIHAAHGAGHTGMDMDMEMAAGDLMERGTMVDGRPCGEWYRFLPRNSQGLRTGGTVMYPACPAGSP